MGRRVRRYLDRAGPVGRATLPALVLILSVLIIPGLALATVENHGELKGTVTNLHYDGPVPDAYVIVRSTEGYVEAKTTDEDGKYHFSLPYGTYDLKVLLHDTELYNATNIYVDPSPRTHDVFVSLELDEVVTLSGVIRLDGERASKVRIVFEGIGNSYRNETLTQKNGEYSVDVPKGKLRVVAFEDEDEVGSREIGPFATEGEIERDVDIERTGVPPTIDEWSDFFVTTWTGLAIWGAIVVGLVVAFVVIKRRVDRWLVEREGKLSDAMAEMIAYATEGYLRVGLLYASLLMLDLALDVASEVAARWIRFWLNALVWILVLWVTARLLLKLVDNLMGHLRTQRIKSGSEVPETAYIFIHGILRYLVIAIFGFFILLILLSGAGLYEEIVGGFVGFMDYNLGYLVLLVLIMVMFFITQRFVKLTLAQMKETSTRFSPQMIGIIGLAAKIFTVFLFSVLFIFTLLTMAGMQEMGALIMALLTTMVGMIIAMTTTGAIGNGLSGMVLMTLKPIEPGQYVEVADDQFGYVVEVTTFFTRLRTFNNEIIEIPNNLVLASKISNYSRERFIGIEIRVGIGYDIPADIVLDLLKNGAKATKGIVKDPKPQAMATDFGDYSVTYLLRAFTDEVPRYFQTKSSLMENIQEIFYTEGIEIMTPWQMVRREGQMPSREEVIKRYMDHMRHRDRSEDGDGSIAAGLGMLDGNDG